MKRLSKFIDKTFDYWKVWTTIIFTSILALVIGAVLGIDLLVKIATVIVVSSSIAMVVNVIVSGLLGLVYSVIAVMVIIGGKK